MAAGTWKIYAAAKDRIGSAAGTIELDGGIFKMALFRTSASAAILLLSTRNLWSSIPGEITVQGGYASGGETLASVTWSTGTSTKQIKWTYLSTGVVFTASGASLNTIKYATIHFSSGAVTSGFLLCFATLSSSAFSISSTNTLTVLPASTGVFTLA